MTLDEISSSILEQAIGWLTRNSAPLSALVFLLLIIQTVRLLFVRGEAARRMSRHRRLGVDAEKRARVLLRKHGYRLDEEQKVGSYEISIDGRAIPIRLRADYIVTKAGRCYVAEVKGGAESVKVTARGTRRQLLEYLLAFEVDGVLLVDMHDGHLHQVKFPGLRSQ